MGKFLGVDFNTDNHLENCYQLFFYANKLKKEISLIQTVHIDLFEIQMRNMNLNEIDRVIVNDYEDLGNFYVFKQFHNICMAHGLEWSFLSQNIHSDIETEVAFLIDSL